MFSALKGVLEGADWIAIGVISVVGYLVWGHGLPWVVSKAKSIFATGKADLDAFEKRLAAVEASVKGVVADVQKFVPKQSTVVATPGVGVAGQTPLAPLAPAPVLASGPVKA